MTGDALLVIKCLFQSIWRLFTGWYIPGTNGVTPAMAFLFFISASVGLRFILRLLGSSPDVSGGFSAGIRASDNIAESGGNPRL